MSVRYGESRRNPFTSVRGDFKKVLVLMVRSTYGGGRGLGSDHNFWSKNSPFLSLLVFNPKFVSKKIQIKVYCRINGKISIMIDYFSIAGDSPTLLYVPPKTTTIFYVAP